MSSNIEGYNYDIFISYRQKDNKGDRWVSEFVDALKTELESTFKEEISVYFDINPHDGLLEVVVRRLSRWFNVEILFDDPEIKSYIYTATFRNENLDQVLKLLKLSAPINYRIIERKVLSGNEFTEQKIYLCRKTF
jgi:Domain of unknown function (DUF4974)